MIPKIIHYCWFGGSPLPEKVKRYIKSWEKHCPDYEIIRWDETNYDIRSIPYIKEAYEAGKWAFVSDYARLEIIYQHGGIYLDTDVELIRGLDSLLDENIFFAMEKKNCYIGTGLGFGATRGHPTINQLMEMYRQITFVRDSGSLNLTPCPYYTTEFFKKMGYCLDDRTQRLNDVLILSSEYFCPMDYNTGQVVTTKSTYGIHWYEASWVPEDDRRILHAKRKIWKGLPGYLAKPTCYLYHKGYRLLEYKRKKILGEKIIGKLKGKG